MKVFESIAKYVSEHGISPEKLAKEAGIAPDTLAAMLDGSGCIFADDLRAICVALGVTADELLKG